MGGVGRFLNQKGGKGLQREKIVGKKVVELFLVGQSRIRKVIAFRGLGLFEEVKKIGQPKQGIKRWQ